VIGTDPSIVVLENLDEVTLSLYGSANFRVVYDEGEGPR